MATPSDETKFALLQQDISYIKDQVRDMASKQNSHYVSKEEFEPIKRIVYGLVGLILVAVVGALVSLVVRQ